MPSALKQKLVDGAAKILGLLPGQIGLWSKKTPREFERRTRERWEDKGAAFTPLPHHFWGDVMRITRGKTQLGLLMYAWRWSAGREREKGEAIPESTPDIEIHALASILDCSDKEVLDDLRDGQNRGLLKWHKASGNSVRIRLHHTDWWTLEDYRDWLKKQKVAEEQAAVEEPPDEAELERRRTALTRLSPKPLPIAAGAKSKSLQVEAGVKSVRCVNGSDQGELVFDPVIEAGEITVTVSLNLRSLQFSDLASEKGSPLPVAGSRKPAAGPVAVASRKNGHSTGINKLGSGNGSGLPREEERLRKLVDAEPSDWRNDKTLSARDRRRLEAREILSGRPVS